MNPINVLGIISITLVGIILLNFSQLLIFKSIINSN